MEPFDDDDFDFDEFSDEEKEEFERERKEEDERIDRHPLLIQANEILKIVDTLLDTCNDATAVDMYGNTLRESAMIVVVKLNSGLRSDSYLVCMQNAAIIRDHAEYLRLSNHMLEDADGFDSSYIKMFREEMEKFRGLFKTWASEIKNMSSDFEDEWGLFLK